MPLVYLTILSLPFTAWFALGSWLRLPVILLLIMFFSTIVTISMDKLEKVKFTLSDLLILSFMLMCSLSSLSNVNHFVSKDINNFMAIIFIVFVMYLFPKMYFENIVVKNNIMRLNNAINITYLVVSFLVIVDFSLVNLFNYKIYDLFVVSRVGNADYFIRSESFITPAGPAEEPATTAFFLNILFYLTLAYNQKKIIISVYYFFWQVLCLVALGSSAGLVFFALSACLAAGFYFKKKYLSWSVLVMVLVLSLYPYMLGYLNNISLFDKISFSEENVSSNLRIHSWVLFYDSLFDGYKELILGHSPAYSKLVVGTGFHSSYFTIWSNYGLIAFVLYILFLANFFLTYALRKNVFVLAVFFVIVFSNAIGDYYYQPIVWLSLVIIITNHKYCCYGNLPEKEWDSEVEFSHNMARVDSA